MQWNVDETQSSFKLAIPDQTTKLGTITATMRLRNQNNATWTTNTAPVDGLLATNVTAGLASVEFLGGSSSLVGLNSGNYRPNPAAYNTAATNATDTAGTFTNTSTAPAVFGARVNASVSIITLNVGYISFTNVSYDLDSLVIPIIGTSFASNGIDVGIADSTVNFDSVAGGTTGLGDTVGQTGPISATNVNGASGSIVNLGGFNYRITVPINMPVFVDLSGVTLNATATGTLVAFADLSQVPEPATLGLVAMGIAGLAVVGRRRRV